MRFQSWLKKIRRFWLIGNQDETFVVITSFNWTQFMNYKGSALRGDEVLLALDKAPSTEYLHIKDMKLVKRSLLNFLYTCEFRNTWMTVENSGRRSLQR